MVKRSTYGHINEEKLEETKKPHFGSLIRPLQIVLSVMTEPFIVKN